MLIVAVQKMYWGSEAHSEYHETGALTMSTPAGPECSNPIGKVETPAAEYGRCIDACVLLTM